MEARAVRFQRGLSPAARGEGGDRFRGLSRAEEGWGVELRGELLAAALMAAMGGSGREGSRGLGLWGVRERGEEKQNRNRVRRLAKAVMTLLKAPIYVPQAHRSCSFSLRVFPQSLSIHGTSVLQCLTKH